MSDGIWSAASGAMAQVRAMDIAAENAANVSTPGYRAERLVFQEVMSRATAGGSSSLDLRYAVAGSTVTDTTPGIIEPTGRSLDAAIHGEGYFVVQTAQGERYTRSGNFKVAVDGTLGLRDGAAVLDSNRRPIRVSPGAAQVSITADGNVMADGATVGELLRVKFATPSLLVNEGGFLLRAPTAADGVQNTTDQTPIATNVVLEPGALEQSNSIAVKSMVQIVSATRSFEVCERMVDAFRDADRKAATQIMGPR